MTLENLTIEVDANTDRAMRSFSALNDVAKRFGSEVTDALTDAVVKGKDLDDVFRSLALSIADTALQAGLKPLQDTLTNGLSGLLSGFSGQGGASSGGGGGPLPLVPFARGGVVSSPSFFPMNGGTGLAGEAGPEAIMPLRRGSDGRLGVGTAGGGSPTNITVNISTPDVNSFRRSEAQVTNALARAVQRSRRSS
ncbi:MAG: phage tail tape measure protein [Pseudomonadota bacterium]